MKNLLVAIRVNTPAHVQSVVERDLKVVLMVIMVMMIRVMKNKQTSSDKNNGDNYLIVIGNNLIERRIVKGGRHVTK